MKIQVKTTALKEAVNKAIKAAINSKMVPLTGYLYLSIKDGAMTVVTCDGMDYFEIKTEGASDGEFSIVLKADVFSKMVAKTTSEFITLELKDNVLMFTGNGTYKMSLPLNEEGNLIKWPTYDIMNENVETGTIKLATIKSIIVSNKAALATSTDVPYLTNYCCASENGVISADGYNICINKSSIFKNNFLILPLVFELLSIFNREDIDYRYDGIHIEFSTDTMRLFVKPQPQLDEYPIEPIGNYGNQEFPSSCAVSKSALISILDRLSLVISDYDVNAVTLDFTKDGLVVTSANGNGSELIAYQESSKFEPFVCTVDAEALRRQVNARTSDILHIEYGLTNVIKFVDNAIIHIVALGAGDSDDDYSEELSEEYAENSEES